MNAEHKARISAEIDAHAPWPDSPTPDDDATGAAFALDPEEVPEKEREAADRAWRAREEDGPCYEAVMIVSPPSTIPSLADALSTMQHACDEYAVKLKVAYYALEAWSELDNVSSRKRYEAVLRLMDALKISSSAADKIATQDDGYAAHRDELTRLANEKADAECERDITHARLISARLVVEAALALLEAEDGRDGEAALDQMASLLREPLTLDNARQAFHVHAAWRLNRARRAKSLRERSKVAP